MGAAQTTDAIVKVKVNKREVKDKCLYSRFKTYLIRPIK